MKLLLIGEVIPDRCNCCLYNRFIHCNLKKNTVGTVITTGFRIVYVQIHSRPTDAHRVF